MFSENIKFWRKRRGLTQLELSKEIHISRGQISKWENNTLIPRDANLDSVANTLAVPVEILLLNCLYLKEIGQILNEDELTDEEIFDLCSINIHYTKKVNKEFFWMIICLLRNNTSTFISEE